MRIPINGMSTQLLVDTGQSVSLLDRDVYINFCKVAKQPSLQKKILSVCGLGDRNIETKGQAEVATTLGVLKFTVVKNMRHQGILGADILSGKRGTFDFKTLLHCLYVTLYVYLLLIFQIHRPRFVL